MDSNSYEYASSYVQINIYNTSIKELEERGVDIKQILQHIGCQFVIMDVPIPANNPRMSYGLPLRMNETESAGCQVQRSNSVLIETVPVKLLSG
ncbi:hypothetical protein KIN20_031836 [Parelaphostrongylus tenuis]|uniref:Uncharacterized protein n=1 Tax=Parelaphostrongylus tenuis TaxID=148309 RepID=A0AAD5R659_PARTN|nr:hypothetical protein KIN20_031836 [Parelaphostrongylus tenuis]